MHRVLVPSALFLLLISSVAMAAPRYGWTLSASSTDPYVNTGASVGGMRYVYLWFACSTTEGMAAAEFDLGGDFPVYAVLPMNGVLNGSSGSSLFLAVAGCPTNQLCAAKILVGDFLPGEICLVPSAASSRNGTYDCGQYPVIHANTWVGFSTKGPVPCGSASSLCVGPTSVDPRSFGTIKGLYR